LLPALAKVLADMTGLDIDEGAFNEELLPDYLRFRIEVVDEDGQRIAVGRALPQLQQQFGQQAQRRFMDQLGSDYQRDGETQWVFGELPRSILVKDHNGQETEAWPAIVDQNDTVGLRLFDTPEEAATEHHHGVLRLLAVRLGDKLNKMHKQHGLRARNLLAWSAAGSPETLLHDLVHSSLALVAANRPLSVRDEAAFASLLADVRAELGIVFRKQADYLDKALEVWAELSHTLDEAYFGFRPEVYNDMRGQLDDLVYEGFIGDLSPTRLAHYPRYLEAMRIRLQSVELDPQRDASRMQEVEPFWHQYLALLEQGRDYDEAMDEFRWLIEEFRVSLFAQQLGSQAKVSVQRLQSARQEIG
jgi:ATP-dependent helicase HrpA